MAKTHHWRPTREPSPALQRARLAKAAPVRADSLRHLAPGVIAQRALAAPQLLRPADLIAIQRTLGNRAVGAMVDRQPIQAKMIVNAPGDEYEREADRVAETVMRVPAMPREATTRPEHAPAVMTKPVSATGGDGSFAAGEDFAERLQASQGRGRPLPLSLRAKFETGFGADFSGVRIHSDAAAEQLSHAIHAQAFTRGSDIFLGDSESAPATTAGQRLLAHELTHVIQQGAAPLKTAATPQQVTQPRAASSKHAGQIQRKKKADNVLKGLAEPKVLPCPDRTVQNEIVSQLTKLINDPQSEIPRVTNYGTEPLDLFCLGGMELPDDLRVSQEELIRSTNLAHITPSGVPDGYNAISKNENLKKLIVRLVMNTLLAAGQIKYLQRSGLTDSGEWQILAEIQYYYNRSQSQTGLHKDTLGQTLFVNLNYVTEQEIEGPEYIVNPLLYAEHETDVKKTLPLAFREHLAHARQNLKQPTKIKATPSIPVSGVVSFVDELIHHATPINRHREVKGEDLDKFLKEKFPTDYQHAAGIRSETDNWWWRTPKGRKWANWLEMTKKKKHNRVNLRESGLSKDLTEELIAIYSDAGRREVSITNPATPGFPYRSVPIRASGTKPLKRTTSERLLRGEIPLKQPERRTFFRTLVRAVPRTVNPLMIGASNRG
jgi:Domain of unknown function (DUF4157)